MEQAQFNVGDVIRVSTKDASEKKVHASTFEGVVIAMRGKDTGRTFTVRKIASGNVVVERIFSLWSPYIQDIKVVKPGKVRRAKLYYLRNK